MTRRYERPNIRWAKIVIAILLGSESTTSLYQANPTCEDVYLRSGTHYKHQLLRNVCNIECCSGRHCHLQKTPMSGAPCLEWDPEPLQVATYESSVSYKIPMSLRAASRNWNSGVTPPYLGGVTGFQNDGHFGCAALRLRIRSLGGDACRRQHSDLGVNQETEYCEYQRSVYDGDQYACTYSSHLRSYPGVSIECNAARRSSRPCSTS
jgi:hypothetical protein